LEVGGSLAEPPVDCDPDHPPDALQPVAYWELQVRVVCPPAVMIWGVAEMEAVGGWFTVTFVDAVAEPPGPVQVMV
jgi:hypothetical protein